MAKRVIAVRKGSMKKTLCFIFLFSIHVLLPMSFDGEKKPATISLMRTEELRRIGYMRRQLEREQERYLKLKNGQLADLVRVERKNEVLLEELGRANEAYKVKQEENACLRHQIKTLQEEVREQRESAFTARLKRYLCCWRFFACYLSKSENSS